MFRGQKANLLNDWLSDTDELQYDDFFAERKTAENPMIKIAKAILAVCKRMAGTGMMTFIENEVPSLLQRLPDSVKAEYYHDETHIRALLLFMR